jgi:hypothetical protein
MINIERTLTAEEELALSRLGITEQKLANQIIRQMNNHIETRIREAKRRAIETRSLAGIVAAE